MLVVVQNSSRSFPRRKQSARLVKLVTTMERVFSWREGNSRSQYRAAMPKSCSRGVPATFLSPWAMH